MDTLPAWSALGPGDRPRIGGKAMQLARLAAAGLPVPRGFVVPTTVFEQALTDLGLWDAARAAEGGDGVAAEQVAEGLRGAALPEALVGDLVNGATGLGARVAVRSSAVDEDGRRRSFAGQHLTRLAVSPREVPRAVCEVWASLYGRSALAYRRGEGPPIAGMAVVVQEMVDPVVSGVLFTVNPHSGSWREMVVEAVYGLGEGLVSGHLTPHYWRVRRPHRLPGVLGRLASRVRLAVVQEDLAPMRERFVDRGGEVVREALPDALTSRPALERDALLRLCRLGLKVERLVGEPQDVEWAIGANGRPVLLQARPITAAGPPRARDDVLWTRRFIGERWSEPATPLGWSLLQPIFEHYIAYPHTQARYLGGGGALRLHRSRPYINATVFRELLFKLPGAPAPSFMLELLPPEEEARYQRAFAKLPGIAVYASILRETVRERRWRRFRWNPLTNPRRWDEFRARLERELPPLRRRPATPTDGVRLVEAQLALVRDYVGVHVTSLLFANIAYQLLDSVLSVEAPERADAWLEALATSPPGNLTLETNAALWSLARTATTADLARLQAGVSPEEPFAAALEGFLSRYGDRSANSWEVFSPRWRSHPELLAPLLAAHHRPGAESPAARAERQQAAFERAQREVSALPMAAPRRAALTSLIGFTRTYLLLRENQRFWFDHLLAALQGALLGLGELLAGGEALEGGGDICFLTWPEVQGVVDGSLPAESAREWVGRRRAQRDEDAANDPPVFLRGDEGLAEPAGGHRLQGLGISPGRARGRVRVLRSPAEGHRLLPGEILVTHAIDPGWTPLLLNAGGVILEIGSRLSHGAVVAREYGVPGVVNLEGIGRRLADGQEVTVDGTRGIVWIHP